MTAELVASLAELDTRRLYLAAGCSSLFTYCTQVLHLSEHAAYGRITAARCARRFPEILDRLSEGSLTLTAVTLLAPLMTARNVGVLISRARHKSRRQVERIVAEVRPGAVVQTVVRKAPSPNATGDPSTNATGALSPQVAPQAHGNILGEDSARRIEPPAAQSALVLPSGKTLLGAHAKPADVRPLSVDTYKVEFTLSQQGYVRLRRAQNLLRHTIPNGDAAVIFERALSVLVRDLEKKKFALTPRPRAAAATETRTTERRANDKKNVPAHSKTKIKTKSKRYARHIAAQVKREVWKRDGGRCAFVGTHGRCRERALLEFHHVIPFADGGSASIDNLQLRCRAHNQHEAILWSGLDPSATRSEPSWHAISSEAANSTSPRGRHPP
jgi:5-methylcytosine-specific restriction endonuclease McrA